VTPVPSKHLLKQGELQLINNINKNQTAIEIAPSELFAMPVTLNALQIEDELIQFENYENIDGKLMIWNGLCPKPPALMQATL
jgi:hypothetical protein